MIITTAFNELEEHVVKAQSLALQLGVRYYPRQKKTINNLLATTKSPVLVVNSNRGLSYYERADEEVFFHPNMAFHRIKQLAISGEDSFVSACKLKPGMTFFDGTFGLGSDSLVASYVVGKAGDVVAVEKSLPLWIIVSEGLNFYAQQNPLWAPLIQRLKVRQADNLDYLRQCDPGSFDVIYFDFMFARPVEVSTGIGVIKPLAIYDIITKEHVKVAQRVAKERVVVKASYPKKTLAELGFKIEKANQRRHFFYATLEV